MSNAIIPLLLDSLASAALIFFAAVGLTLVFSVLRVLNVAHGSLYSIGGYVAASICLFIASRHCFGRCVGNGVGHGLAARRRRRRRQRGRR